MVVLVSDINFEILFSLKFTSISSILFPVSFVFHRVFANIISDSTFWNTSASDQMAEQLTTEYYTNSDCLHLKSHCAQGYGCHHHQLLQFNEIFCLSVARCSLPEYRYVPVDIHLSDCQ